ncbi:unnamed protein product, partial [Prorocentrum cordatum]
PWRRSGSAPAGRAKGRRRRPQRGPAAAGSDPSRGTAWRRAGMPPKAPVDKAKQKQKEKIAEDKTFGLKNKNKSKSVQKYIKSIVNNAQGAPKGGKEEQARKEK